MSLQCSKCGFMTASDWTYCPVDGTILVTPMTIVSGHASTPQPPRESLDKQVVRQDWETYRDKVLAVCPAAVVVPDYEIAGDFNISIGTGTSSGNAWRTAARNLAAVPASPKEAAGVEDVIPAELADKPYAWDMYLKLKAKDDQMKGNRRADILQMIPAELAIRNAVIEVEKLGADTRLTDIVVALSAQQSRLADWCEATGNIKPEEAAGTRLHRVEVDDGSIEERLPLLDGTQEERDAGRRWAKTVPAEHAEDTLALYHSLLICRERQLRTFLREAAGVSGERIRHNALLDALNAVAQERLERHEELLLVDAVLQDGDAAYSSAINDCEVAITKLMSAPPSGEQGHEGNQGEAAEK